MSGPAGMPRIGQKLPIFRELQGPEMNSGATDRLRRAVQRVKSA
jgi:hypothetical protein